MVIDTNILIAYLDGESGVTSLLSDWKQSGRPLFISSISVAEVLSLPTLTHSDIENIRKFLSEFISIYFDNQIAERTAFLRRIYHISVPDAAVAATALNLGVSIVSRDKVFKKIKEIVSIEI